MGCSKKAKLEKESPYERKLRELSKEKQAIWEKTYRPLEDELIAKTKMAGSDTQRDLSAGRAKVGAIRKISGMAINLDPNSKTKAAAGETFAKEALAGAVNASDAAQEEKHRGGMVKVAGFGRGQSALGVGALKQAANLEVAKNAVDTSFHNFQENLDMDTLGQVGGMAAFAGYDHEVEKGWWGKPKNPDMVGDIDGDRMRGVT